jgi:hypothetical protein
MEKSTASWIIKRIKEAEATAFWDMTPCCTIETYIFSEICRYLLTGEWRELGNEELNDLYSSPNIVRVIKSRRMRWVGYVARVVERRGVYRVLVGKPE